MKKRQIKSFDGSFPSETSLSFLILAHVLRHNNKTPTYKQCLLLLNKSRPSPASRPPRFRCVRFLLLLLLNTRSREKISSLSGRARAFLSEFTFCVSNFKRYENSHVRKKGTVRRRWKPLSRARERERSESARIE